MAEPDPIRDYIAANRDTYTREALRDQLLAAGHDPAAIEAALNEAAATRPGQASESDRRTFRRWAFGLHIGAVVVLVALIVLLKGADSFGMAMLGAGVLAIPLLIGWGISSLVGRALLPATGPTIALVVPLISAVALSGTCFALLNSTISAPPRDGTVHLVIQPPRSFDASGAASCHLRDNGVQVLAFDFGSLDGRPVSVSMFWYEAATEFPVELSVETVGAEAGLYFSATSATTFASDVAPDFRSGTLQFEGLAGEPSGAGASAGEPELISGTLTWDCE